MSSVLAETSLAFAHAHPSWCSLVAQTVKCLCLQCGRPGFDPWVRKILWRGKWQPTPVLLPGKSHGRRSMIGYSPWGRRESDKIEWLHFTLHGATLMHLTIKQWHAKRVQPKLLHQKAKRLALGGTCITSIKDVWKPKFFDQQGWGNNGSFTVWLWASFLILNKSKIICE